MKTRNSEVLEDFVNYCKTHPDQRFWQALRNWSEFDFILGSHEKPFQQPFPFQDTFYFEGKSE